MRLYHGSPCDLDVLIPHKGRGFGQFENLSAVFMTKTFLHAALYAIGKSLKGRASFGVSESKLIISGDFELSPGYVYEIESDNPIVGPRGQYASLNQQIPLKKSIVYPGDYIDNVLRVNTKNDIFENL